MLYNVVNVGTCSLETLSILPSINMTSRTLPFSRRRSGWASYTSTNLTFIRTSTLTLPIVIIRLSKLTSLQLVHYLYIITLIILITITIIIIIIFIIIILIIMNRFWRWLWFIRCPPLNECGLLVPYFSNGTANGVQPSVE